MEFLSEFVVFLLQCAFWYFVVGIITMPMRRKMDQKREELDEVMAKLKEIVHVVNVEKHGDYYYWFDADDDEPEDHRRSTRSERECEQRRVVLGRTSALAHLDDARDRDVQPVIALGGVEEERQAEDHRQGNRHASAPGVGGPKRSGGESHCLLVS